MERDPQARTRYRASAERHVYVIEFTTGVVKVGQARNEKSRLADHGRTANLHGVAISRSWISGPHKDYTQNEAALITFCGERWSLASGKEYFANANYDEVLAFAQTLPMKRVTEADLDEFARRLAEHEGEGRRFIETLWALSPGSADRRHESDATGENTEEEPVLLEDIAPNFEQAEDVTAASMAAHHAALAALNHHLRLKLNPFTDTREWKESLAQARHSYGVSLLLRALQEQAGVAVADDVARHLWSDWHDLAGDWGDRLTAWVVEDGIDPAVLAEMAQTSYEQVQKLKTLRVSRPAELPLGGEA